MDVIYLQEEYHQFIKATGLGVQMEEWTKEYFWLSNGAMQMQVRCKEGYAMYYFPAKPKSDKTYVA